MSEPKKEQLLFILRQTDFARDVTEFVGGPAALPAGMGDAGACAEADAGDAGLAGERRGGRRATGQWAGDVKHE
jgi:hypothetical protein